MPYPPNDGPRYDAVLVTDKDINVLAMGRGMCGAPSQQDGTVHHFDASLASGLRRLGWWSNLPKHRDRQRQAPSPISGRDDGVSLVSLKTRETSVGCWGRRLHKRPLKCGRSTWPPICSEARSGKVPAVVRLTWLGAIPFRATRPPRLFLMSPICGTRSQTLCVCPSLGIGLYDARDHGLGGTGQVKSPSSPQPFILRYHVQQRGEETAGR